MLRTDKLTDETLTLSTLNLNPCLEKHFRPLVPYVFITLTKKKRGGRPACESSRNDRPAPVAGMASTRQFVTDGPAVVDHPYVFLILSNGQVNTRPFA
ncbi:hypothetical protein EVAR_31560_1 [Eumeta japonica]|uniref:Serpin domain-containing protein n=1 Tax=Eumeta variegata TaxID=151549 RepID=A0A4C1V785_EUMVA|nr:hypothetical protein EVAR_31560_1 [Eumeta japonica]